MIMMIVIALVLVVFIVAAILVNTYYYVIMQYMGLFFEKFETIMEDESSEYRIKEMQSHIELLIENPIAGIGCGALNHRYYTSLDNYFLGHCMLTSLWALNGLIVGTVMLISLIGTVFKAFSMWLRNRTLRNVMAMTLAGTILFLATSSAGFAKYSTHFMMLLLGCCFADEANERKKQP